MLQPEALWGVGIAVVFVALFWGWSYTRSRNRANDAITEAATKAEYDRPESYDPEKVKRTARPS
jgi:hypothetical protein